jgi:hypothetical protein
MVAGVVTTVPFCGACGFDANGGLNDDVFCDACGADLNQFGFAGILPPDDLVAALGTDEVVFTWTAALDTQDVLYQIDDGAPVFDDDASSPYTVAAPAVAKVALAVRTVLNGVIGPWSVIQASNSGQSPPTTLVAVAASLAVDFTFTEDPAGDSVDLSYTVDAGPENVVNGVVTGVSIAALEGEVISGKVRTVQAGTPGLYGTADAETALA